MKNYIENFLYKEIKIGIILILFTPLLIGPFGLSFSSYPKAVFFRALIEIIFIFYLLLVLINRKYLPKISILFLTISFFFLILLLTGFTGINPYRSFWGDLERVEGIILYLHLFLFFLILTAVFQKKEEWFWFLKVAVVASGLSSLAGILQKFGIFDFYGISLPSRISGTFSNPDFFAPYLVLAIFVGIFILATEKKKNWIIVSASILVLNFITLILSGTRSSWVGMAVGLSFLFLFWFFRYSNLNKKSRTLILSGILLLALFFLLIALNQDIFLRENFIFQRVFSIFNAESLYSRLIVWKLSFGVWQERPILGWGLESFGYFFDKNFKANYLYYLPERIFFDRPHNQILGLMSDTGLLGVLGYLSIFIAVFYLLFRHIKLNSHNFKEGAGITINNKKSEKILALILVSLFISHFIQNLFVFDTISTYLIFFLVLGFVNNNAVKKEGNISILQEERGKKNNQIMGYFKIGLVSFLVFVSLAIFYYLNFKPTLASLAFIRGAQLEGKNLEKALLRYKEGVSAHTIFDKDLKLALAARLVSILENGRYRGAEGELIKYLSEIKPFLEEEIKKPDKRYLYLYELLARVNERIYLFSGDPIFLGAMEEISKEALIFNNQKPEFYRLIGRKKILEGNYKEGEEFFEKAFDLTPGKLKDRSEFYKNLGTSYIRTGDERKAVANFKKAIDIEYYLKKFSQKSAEKVLPEYTREEASFMEKVAFLFYALGDRETCREIYRRAIEIYPEHQQELMSNLEILMNQPKKN